jgi:hypothetical protein
MVRLRKGRPMGTLFSCLVPQLDARLVSRSSLEPHVKQAAFGLELLGKLCLSY